MCCLTYMYLEIFLYFYFLISSWFHCGQRMLRDLNSFKLGEVLFYSPENGLFWNIFWGTWKKMYSTVAWKVLWMSRSCWSIVLFLLGGFFVCLFDCWLCWEPLLLCAGFSSVVASCGYSSLQYVGFSLLWLLLLWSKGLSSWGTQA